MSLSITTSDNQNNSGMTCTVSGSDAASANNLYVSAVHQGNSPLVWTLAGSRTGDGTVNLPVAAGYYFMYCSASLVGGAPALSPPIIGLASSAVLSNQTQVELAIQAKIQTLTLSGLATPPGNLPAGRVYRFDTPMSDELLPLVTVPCIIVTPAPAPETVEGLLTGKDDLGYAVAVIILDHCPPRQQGLADTYKLWRHQIMAALRFQRLNSVLQVMKVVPEPREVLAWQPPKYDYIFSAVIYRAVVRELRGAGT